MPFMLGTVQFGLDYGMTNARGKVPEAEVEAILLRAAELGVGDLDTAATYGDSEEVLGRVLNRLKAELPRPFKLTTKTIRVDRTPVTPADVGIMRDAILRSRDRLRVDHLDTVLVKFAGDILAEGGAGLAGALQALVADGVVGRLGLSWYVGQDLRAVAARLPLSVVQLPFSVFDQRPLLDGTLAWLADQGIEVHARSVLLQGVLAAAPDDLPEFLAPLRGRLAAFQAAARTVGTTPVRAAVGFVERHPLVARAVIGVTSVAELEEVLAPHRSDGMPWADFAVAEPALVACQEWPA